MATATETKKGRGRPRTKPIHRVETGTYESRDGRFVIHGLGKRGRKQEWWIEDTIEGETSAFTKDTYFPSLNVILTVLSKRYPDSF